MNQHRSVLCYCGYPQHFPLHHYRGQALTVYPQNLGAARLDVGS